MDEPLRRLRHVPAGGIGGGAGAQPRARAGGLLAEAARASELRRVLARPGRGQDPGGPAAEGAGDAGPQPLGPGGHLRRDRRLPGDRAEGHGQRQGVPGHGPLASRPGDRGRQHPRRLAVRQRHRAHLPPGDPAPVPGPLLEGRRAQGRRGARRGVRDRDERVAAPARLAGRLRQRLHDPADAALSRPRASSWASPRRSRGMRRSRSTSPTPPSPCPSAPGPFSRSATTTA